MNLQVNQSVVNALNVQSQKKAETAKQDKENKPQVKEHCSSKAGKALRGMALGLMMAAGVASVGKATTVNAVENHSANNQTAVTQEAETNVSKTAVEMAVDELMESNGETVSLRTGNKNDCHGAMSNSILFKNGRNYDVAKISDDGKLKFYDEVTNRTDSGTHKTYFLENSFDLGVESEGGSVNLQTGSRFEEVKSKNGDYVELAEDGTFNVYNSDGEQIGHVKCDTKETYNAKLLAWAGIGVVGAGVAAATELKKRNSEIE